MATTLKTADFDGFPDGMNMANPSHEIKDTQARWLIDPWIFQPGFTDRRGPVEGMAGFPAFSDKAYGIAQATKPDGTSVLAVLHGSSTTLKLGVYNSLYDTRTDVTLTTSAVLSPYPLVDTKPALNGHTLIGISHQTERGTSFQLLVLWRGASLPDYATGTLTSTLGSKAVTGSGTSWTANVEPGMYLFNGSGQLIGTVQKVTSNTALTLEEPAITAVAAASYNATAVRGLAQRAVSGAMTSSTSSTAVTGSNTKFLEEGIGANWRIFRRSDGAFVGTVSSVTNDEALVLTGNAAIALNLDEYFAVNNSADYSTSIKDTGGTNPFKPGWLNAVYADRQWFSNRDVPADEGGEWVDRIWYTGPNSLEDIDKSTITGNYIPIRAASGLSSANKAMIPAYNSLLVIKEKETYALFGTDENTFEPRKIIDDGTLSTMSAVSYEGGVIYAGSQGIYHYDGVEAKNIVEDSLGQWYANALKNFDPKTYRMWATVERDHYLLFIESLVSPTPVIKGSASVTPTRFTIVINLKNNAVVMFNNVDFRGSASLPASTQKGPVFVVNDSTKGYICSWDTLFDADGIDAFACEGNTAGPDLYIESKKYSLGDGLRKKLWKQLMLHYLVGGDVLKLDTVVGLNVIGATTTSTWGITTYWWDKLATLYASWDILSAGNPTWDSLTGSVFFIKRLKFLKRSQYFAFRIYQNSNAVTTATLGSFALGYKLQRPGRV